MGENKEVDISKTIMETIKLLEEKLVLIKELNVEKHQEMREKLDNIYNQSKNKTLNVFETVNLLMQLQNEAIAFMDESMLSKNNQLTIYNEHKKGFFSRIFEKIKKVFTSKLNNEQTAVESTEEVLIK